MFNKESSTNLLDYSITISIYNYNESNKYDISDQVLSLNLFENILNPSIDGKLSIIDSIGLFELLPIIGQERINITIKKNDYIFLDYDYYVYDITDRLYKNTNTQLYTLHVITKEAFINQTLKISKSYKNTKISDIVKRIMNEYVKSKKPLFIEETKHSKDIVFPNISPFKAINYLTNFSINNKDKSNYFFYESRSAFNYASLDRLFESSSVKTLTYKLIFNEDGLNQDHETLTNIVYTTNNNTLNNFQHGMYANKLISVDPIIRKTNVIKYNYSDGVNKLYTSDHMGFNKPDTKIYLRFSNSDRINNEYVKEKETIIPDYVTSSFQKRRSENNAFFNSFVCDVTMPGDMILQVGDIVTLNIPSLIPGNQTSSNQLYSGDYLINELHHDISIRGFYTHCQLIKRDFNKI